MSVKEIISEIKCKIDAAGDWKHVYFGGLRRIQGGDFPRTVPAPERGQSFGATTYTSNEFVHAAPKELDSQRIAVICSLKATPETVEAVKTANAAGAVTIAMTGSTETGMAQSGTVCGDLFQR